MSSHTPTRPMIVAVVGLGAMGSRIARRLLERGVEVVVWNRSPERLVPLVDLGAIAVATPAAAAARADALITMVTGPAALRAVSEGSAGIGGGAHAGLTVIEMSTVGPAAIAKLRATLPAETVLLDAPVLGSLAEAEAGELTLFVGGAAADVERVRPLLDELGRVADVGTLGSGAAAKLVANAALLGMVALLGEAVALGRALGLTDDALYRVLAATPLGDQAQRRRPAIDAGDYPPRFPISLAVKDGDLISEAAHDAGRELRLIEATRRWLADTAAAGFSDRDYTSVLGAILAQEPSGSEHDTGRGAADEPVADLTFDGLIVDLDGVIWLGDQPIDGAVEAVATLRARGTRLLFLTNDPSRSRAEQAARLEAIGIAATADDVMTSATATVRFLAGKSDLRARRVLLIGAPAFRQELAEAGCELLPIAEAERAGSVVVGGHNGFDFAELRAATRAIAVGAQLFAASRDRFVPTADGPDPATGAILASVEAASGVTATVVGKPEPYMFEIAREALSFCRRVAVVGDNLESDIAGAKRARLDAILVLSGAATAADVAGADHQPDLVVESLADLAVRMTR